MCSNERLPNAPKHYETHKKRSLGSNWVYRVHSLRKLPMRFHATNLCINSTILAHFASSFMQERNNPKCIQTLQNAPIHTFRVQWGWIGCVHCEKFQCDFMPRTCALFLPFQPTLYRVLCTNERNQNAPKHYKTHQNMSLQSNGVDLVRSLTKIPLRLRGTNFCINCSSSSCFAPSFMQ